MTNLHLRLLGGFQLTTETEGMLLPTDKIRGLLARLARRLPVTQPFGNSRIGSGQIGKGYRKATDLHSHRRTA